MLDHDQATIRPSEADVKAATPTGRALDDMGRTSLVLNTTPVNNQAKLTAPLIMRTSTESQVGLHLMASRIDP